MTQRDAFGHETTTDQVLEGIDLTGKRALVTGATGGLGAETARALAGKGAEVVVTARDLEKAKGVVEAIRASTGQTVEVESLELDSLASIRAFAERFLAKYDSLNLLVNNAAVMACPLGHTQDGFELQFGTNHLGHFLMTCLIAPALVRGAPARIVSVSSLGHERAPVDFDDPNFERREYDKWASYGQAKTANVLFAVELERRLGERGVHANAIHPGVIPTDLARHLHAEDYDEMRARAKARGTEMKLKTIEAGAATQVYAATAPELEGRGGLYLEDCQVAEVNDGEMIAFGVRPYAVDPDNARRLWELSEKLVGESFPL